MKQLSICYALIFNFFAAQAHYYLPTSHSYYGNYYYSPYSFYIPSHTASKTYQRQTFKEYERNSTNVNVREKVDYDKTLNVDNSFFPSKFDNQPGQDTDVINEYIRDSLGLSSSNFEELVTFTNYSGVTRPEFFRRLREWAHGHKNTSISAFIQEAIIERKRLWINIEDAFMQLIHYLDDFQRLDNDDTLSGRNLEMKMRNLYSTIPKKLRLLLVLCGLQLDLIQVAVGDDIEKKLQQFNSILQLF